MEASQSTRPVIRTLAMSLLLGLTCGMAHAGPARFWIAPSGGAPLAVPARGLELDLFPSQLATFDIWAQPGSYAGSFGWLSDVTLNVVSSAPLVDFVDLSVVMHNPAVDGDGNPATPPTRRYSHVFDGTLPFNATNPGVNFITLSVAEIRAGEGQPDAIRGLAGRNVALTDGGASVGFGGNGCAGGDPHCVMIADKPVWRVATFGLETLAPTIAGFGVIDIRLQIGRAGMRHAGGLSAQTDVVFAPPGVEEPIYNAGLGPGREATPQAGDYPELRITIFDALVGDYNKDGRVDAADYTVWRDLRGSTHTLANRSPHNSGVVGAQDYEAWLRNYGRTAGAAATRVPEPVGVVVVCVLIFAGLVKGRGRFVGVLAVTVCLLPADALATIFWDRGAGTGAFGNVVNWSISDSGGPNPSAADANRDGKADSLEDDLEFNIATLNSPQTINLSNSEFPAGTRFIDSIRFDSTGSVTIQPGGGADDPKIGLNGSTARPGILGDAGVRVGLKVESNAGLVDIQAPIYLRSSQDWVSNNQLTVSGTVNLSGHALVLRGSNTISLTNSVYGNGYLAARGGSNIYLSGNNSWTGGIAIGGSSVVYVSSDSNLGSGQLVFDETGNGRLGLNGSFSTSSTRPLVMLTAGTIDTRGHTLTWNGPISGGGPLTKTNEGTLILTANNSNWGGGVTVAGGTLIVNTSSLVSDAVNNSWLVFDQPGNGVYARNVIGSGSLVKRGAGQVYLTGVHSYYGGGHMIVEGGSLRLNAASLLNDVYVHAGTFMEYNESTNHTNNRVINGGGGLVKNGAGILTLTANNNYGWTTVNGGVLQGTTNSIRGEINNNSQVNFNQNFHGAYNSRIWGSGHVVITGGGRVDLNSAQNNFSGGTFVTSGTLGASPASLGTGQVTLNGGGLQLFGGGTANNPLSLPLPTNSAIGVNAGADVVWNGVVSGGGGIDKQDGGYLRLTNSNSYAGGTVLSGGVLLANQGSLGTGRLTLNGGIFGTSAVAHQGNHTFTNDITINPGGGTIDTMGITSTLSGQISGSGGLTKVSSGTLVLSNTNSYSGGTTISSGTLVAAGSSGGSGTFRGGSLVTIEGGATLQLNGGDALGLFQNFPVIQNNGGVITTNGAAVQHNLGVVRLRGGTLTAIGNGNVAPVGNYILNDVIETQSSLTASTISANRITLRNGSGYVGGRFNVADGAAANDLVVTSAIGNLLSDVGSVVKDGPGTLAFTGGAVNIYTGGTAVNGGTLVLNRVTDFATQQASGFGVAVGDLTINSGATVRVANYSQIRDDASVTVLGGTLHIEPGVIEGIRQLNLSNGSVTGSGTLVITPGGSISASGISSLSSAPIPQLSPGQSLNVDVGAGGTLTLQNGVDGSSPSQVLNKRGSGTLVVKSLANHAGTSVEAGKLVIDQGSVHMGSVTLGGGGVLGGRGTIQGSVFGPGKVAPGLSPGILTINGNFMQSPTSVLEIEVGGLTPGTQHDQIRIGGVATLDGRYEFSIVNGFVPAVDQSITFIDTFDVDGPGGPISPGSIAAGTKPREAVVSGLPAGIAFQVVSDTVANQVRLDFVDENDIFLNTTSSSTPWFVAVGKPWLDGDSTVRDPSEADRTFIRNQSNAAQEVRLNSPDATTGNREEINRLIVGDDSHPIKLGIDNDYELQVRAGEVQVVARGTIELNGGTLDVRGNLPVDVKNGGQFTGNGSLLGSLNVGVEGAGVLAPGVGSAAGTLSVTGNYTQGAGGVLDVDLMGTGASQFDRLSVSEGVVQLGGTLSVNVHTTITAGDTYSLISAAAGAGEFQKIEVVDPSGLSAGFYPSPFYGSAPSSLPGVALVTSGYESGLRWLQMGDADADGQVTPTDAEVFAAVLINPELQGYRLAPNKHAALNFVTGFDFYTEGALAGEQVIDVDDIQGFLEAMAASQSISMSSASILFAEAYDRVAQRLTVPEPTAQVICLVLCVNGLLSRRRLSAPRD